MSRDALVVGINTYDFESLRKLKAPAEDAEAIAQRLVLSGDFRVRRLPEIKDKDTNSVRVGRKTRVTLTQLEDALIQLFKPTGDNIPDTALFYFSGHGLRKDRGIPEGFLATSDVNPELNHWGLRLKWLRELLQESPVGQQIIWLDCCYSGELLNFDEADPGERGKGRDRCFIAASREYEVAYEETAGNHGVLTEVLLRGLDPRQQVDGVVNNFTLVEFINQSLRTSTQRPLYANSGGRIILTGKGAEQVTPILAGICPYKGLSYFDWNDDDPKYFYGRTALTDALINKVREGNFLAVVGASGSGKSSVVRAGLLYQLKRGERLSGSDQWSIYILKPGEHPLQSLAEVFLEPGLSRIDRADQLRKAQELINAGAVGLGQLVRAIATQRVVLVIDQFEECFTLCQDRVERQQFFDGLLGAAAGSDRKLCVVLTLRADFFNKCLEHGELAKQIEAHLVAVTPLDHEELEQAIVEPAKQVGLEVESDLVTQMLTDVEDSPGSLPLLQYTLTELWKRRTVNWLTFAAYAQLGGVRGTLERRAEEVYAGLSPQEQEIVRHIFLELTQLGEGTEDTRRRVAKRVLVGPQQPAELVDRVIQQLSAERLIVTTELIEKSQTSDRLEVIDVAHEALIRHWPRLRRWIEENRTALKQKREIEAAAEDWLETGKSAEAAYLWQGSKLIAAEEFFTHHRDRFPLSTLAQEFLQVSQHERDRQKQTEQNRRRWRMGIAIAFPTIITTIITLSTLLFAEQEKQSQKDRDAIFLSSDTTEVLAALPKVLQQAHIYKKQVDKFQDPDDEEGAIAYYNTHSREIKIAFAYYRQLLKVAGELQGQVQSNSDLLTTETVETISQMLNQVLQESENSLAELLLKYRIPELKQYLFMKPDPKFGQLLMKTRKEDFENQYTEGALRTTYELLMRNSGTGADLNDDGLIRDQQEANQLPCEVLKEIERLWRQATGDRCGWYGPESEHEDPDCKVLDINASTLTMSIFGFPTEFPVKRLNHCEIPSPAITDVPGGQP
jgi:energy-coupling factor transporter ATP-binding protein EcfA2